MKKYFKNAWSWLLFICFLLSFVTMSCDKEEEDIKSSKTDKEIIASLGFNVSDLQDMGDYFLLEGDILLKKDYLKMVSSRSTNEIQLKQASINSFPINYANQRTITVRVDNSIPTTDQDNWRTEIGQAITEWNSIYNSNIHLELVTTATANVSISSDESLSIANRLSDSSIAASTLPRNGNVGSNVYINLDFNGDRAVSTGQKKYNMVHELGHCLGFVHTNWSKYPEEPSGVGVPNTPNTGSNPDASSVMNGGTALNSWSGFSNYDQVALTTLYPAFNVTLMGYPSSITTSDVGRIFSLSISCPQSGLTCNWSVGGGTLISGQGQSSASVKVENPSTFGIRVIVTNSYGEQVIIDRW